MLQTAMNSHFPEQALALLTSMLIGYAAIAAEGPRSHPPLRAFPQASNRPLAAGPAYYVDAKNGDDSQDGSKGKPWKTIRRAIDQLAPGDTLYLRGGVYYENVV